MTANIGTPSREWEANSTGWTLSNNLRATTEAMRKAAQEDSTLYLPRRSAEELTDWEARRTTTFLYPMFDRAIDRVLGKAFSQPPHLTGDVVPDWMQSLSEDMDRKGQALQDAVHEAFDKDLGQGAVYIMVDHDAEPSVDRSSDSGPYFIVYSADQKIGEVEGEKGEIGPRSVRFRWFKNLPDPENEFAEVEWEFVIRWTAPTRDADGNITAPGDWSRWKRRSEETGDFEADGGETHNFPGIPLVKISTGGSQSAFQDLAWVNLEHWISSSHQRDVTDVTRITKTCIAGAPAQWVENKDDGTPADGPTIGPRNAIITTTPKTDFDVWHPEFSREGPDIGLADLQRLEERGETLGADPFIRRSGTQTATGRSLDMDGEVCDAKRWVRAHEAGWRLAFEYALIWINGGSLAGEELAEDVGVALFSDFEASTGRAENLDSLHKARANSDLARLDYLKGLRRHGVIPDDADVEEMTERADTEAEAALERMVEMEQDAAPDEQDDEAA